MANKNAMLLMQQVSVTTSDAALLSHIAENERFYHQPDSVRMQDLNSLIIQQEGKAEFTKLKMNSDRCLSCSTVLSCEKKCF